MALVEMTPGPNRDDDIARRMDTLERTQAERHSQNQYANNVMSATLLEIQKELRPLSSSLRSIMGDENYKGRMAIAEENIDNHAKDINGLKIVIAKWSGGIIVAMTLLHFLDKLLKWS